MKGAISQTLEAVVPIMLFDPQGQAFEVDAVIDTGATSWLTLPAEIIEELHLSQTDV